MEDTNYVPYMLMDNRSYGWDKPVGGASMDLEALKEEEEYEPYVYSYEDSVNTLPVIELMLVALVYGTTLLLGVTGNSLVIFSILRYRRMQTVTNIFLTSLATADLMLVILCVPIKFAKWFAFSWEFGEVLCKLVHYLQNVSVICSVLTLTSMSIERYYAIIHPLQAKFRCTVSRARKVIGFVWAISFILAVPILIGQVHVEVGVVRRAYWCIKDWSTPNISKTYEIGMLLLVFVFPFLIITFAYVNICMELWVMTSRRAVMRAQTEKSEMSTYKVDSSNGSPGNNGMVRLRKQVKPANDDNNTKKQVIKMLVIVISLFAVCWAPVLLDNVLASFGIVERYNYGWIKHMRQAFSLMSYANSCVNPIVYAFMSKNFRDSFKSAMCSCVPAFCAKYKLCDRDRGQLRRQGSFTTQNSSMSYYSTSMVIKPELIPAHQQIHVKGYDPMDATDTSV